MMASRLETFALLTPKILPSGSQTGSLPAGLFQGIVRAAIFGILAVILVINIDL